MRKGKKASFTEIVKIAEKLKTAGHMIDGFWVYADGFDDTSIADEIGVSHFSVAKARTELYGKMRTRLPTLKLAQEERIAAIEARLTMLEERFVTALKLSNIARVRS